MLKGPAAYFSIFHAMTMSAQTALLHNVLFMKAAPIKAIPQPHWEHDPHGAVCAVEPFELAWDHWICPKQKNLTSS